MNFQERYLQIAKEFSDLYKEDKNIRGMTLNGGVSRGTGDIFSEIDIYFYVINKNKSTFPPKIKGIGGDINVDGVWFEFKVKEIKEEKSREWGLVDRWDAQHGKILFEKNKEISRLLKEKVKFRKDEKRKLQDEFAFKANWCLQLAEVFDHRKDLRHAHLLVNESLDAIVNYCFIMNDQFIPYFKWKYYYFSLLEKPTKKIKDLVFELFLIKGYSRKELYRRMDAVRWKILVKGLGQTEDWPHKQDVAKIKEFRVKSLENIQYTNPFGEGYTFVQKKKKNAI